MLQRSTFHPVFTPSLLREFHHMVQNISSQLEQVVDARGPANFSGKKEELEPGDLTFPLATRD